MREPARRGRRRWPRLPRDPQPATGPELVPAPEVAPPAGVTGGKAAITRIVGARAPRLAKTRYVQAQHGGQKHRRCFELRVMPGTKCASRAQALIGAVQSGPREVERLRCLRPLQFHSTQRLRMRTQARRERERRGDSTLPRGPSCARWQPHAAFEHAIRISCFAHQCRQAPRRCRVWTSRYRWEC